MSSYQSLSREDSSDYDVFSSYNKESNIFEFDNPRGGKDKSQDTNKNSNRNNNIKSFDSDSSFSEFPHLSSEDDFEDDDYKSYQEKHLKNAIPSFNSIEVPTTISNFEKEEERIEIRIRSILLVLILSTILASANCYLGLYSGISISVSIPSAIIAFSILSPFKTSIYEVNAVQTGASAGSTLVAGIIFTLPALVIINYWNEIKLVESAIVGILGGTLGVLFSIPLRSALLHHANLLFPEGVATAQILFLCFPQHSLNNISNNNFVSSDNVPIVPNDRNSSYNTVDNNNTPNNNNNNNNVNNNNNNNLINNISKNATVKLIRENNEEKLPPLPPPHPPSTTASLIVVSIGVLIGFLIKSGSVAFMFWPAVGEWAIFLYEGMIVYYISVNFSAALVSVGFITKFRTTFCLFIGCAINWWVFIPFFSFYFTENSSASDDLPSDLTAIEMAKTLWADNTRYIGVGAMFVGGLGTLFFLFLPIFSSLKLAFSSFSSVYKYGMKSLKREERDIPIVIILICIVLSIVPLYLLFYYFTRDWLISIVTSIIMIIFGGVFAAIGAYMSGVVGSSSNPVSGVTLATLLVSSVILLLFLGSNDPVGPATSILIASVICCAVAVSGDNMQDLKVGYMVKSTPYKLQIMQLIGTIIPALVIPVVTSLVIKAYGIAGEASEEYPYPLPAPQANLMADVAEAIFDGTLPYTMILIGGILAIIVIASDFLCMIFKLNFRIAVLAVSLGLYIPMDVILTIFIGGILSSIVLWILSKYKNYTESWMEDRYQVGILLSAGLITGEALCGIITAVPIVLSGKNDILAIFDVTPQTYLGLLCLLISMLLLIFIPTYPVFSPLFEKFQKTNK